MKTDERAQRSTVRARLAALGDAALALLLSLIAIDIVLPHREGGAAPETRPGSERAVDEHAGVAGGAPEG